MSLDASSEYREHLSKTPEIHHDKTPSHTSKKKPPQIRSGDKLNNEDLLSLIQCDSGQLTELKQTVKAEMHATTYRRRPISHMRPSDIIRDHPKLRNSVWKVVLASPVLAELLSPKRLGSDKAAAKKFGFTLEQVKQKIERDICNEARKAAGIIKNNGRRKIILTNQRLPAPRQKAIRARTESAGARSHGGEPKQSDSASVAEQLEGVDNFDRSSDMVFKRQSLDDEQASLDSRLAVEDTIAAEGSGTEQPEEEDFELDAQSIARTATPLNLFMSGALSSNEEESISDETTASATAYSVAGPSLNRHSTSRETGTAVAEGSGLVDCLSPSRVSSAITSMESSALMRTTVVLPIHDRVSRPPNMQHNVCGHCGRQQEDWFINYFNVMWQTNARQLCTEVQMATEAETKARITTRLEQSHTEIVEFALNSVEELADMPEVKQKVLQVFKEYAGTD